MRRGPRSNPPRFAALDGCVTAGSVPRLEQRGNGAGARLGLASPAMFRAFVRGRHSSNFYRTPFKEELLCPTVGETRRELALNRPPPTASAADKVGFAVWSVLAVVTLVTTAAIALAPFLGLVAFLSR